MIKAKQAELIYKDGTVALKPFDLDIDAGELVYIIGPSGSGKTSFLKLVMGMEFATSGSLSVLNTEMLSSNRRKIQDVRKDLGPVYQAFRLLEGRTVLENVILGMRFLNMPFGEIKKAALESIDKVGLSHKITHTVDRLSWGECQRVSIARAVARSPKLIVADEPTGNLDVDNAQKILSLLRSFVSPKTTVVITTHATHLIEPFNKGILIKMDAGNMHIERRG